MSSSTATICRRGTGAKPGFSCRPADAASVITGFVGFGQGEEHARPGAFAFDHAFQVADHTDADVVTRLERDDAQSGALGPEGEPPVKAAIGAFLAEVAGPGGDEGERSSLELKILAARSEVAGGVDVWRDAVGGEQDGGEGIAQAFLRQADGKVGDVDADPMPPEYFRRMDGGAAAAERIKHPVAGAGGCVRGGRRASGWVDEAFVRRTEYKGPAEAGPRDADKIETGQSLSSLGGQPA